jgi:hypothetical protein
MRTIELLGLALVAGCTSATQRAVVATAPSAGSAQAAADTTGAAAVAEGWWRALTLGDTAYIALHSSDGLTLTLSNGQGFGRRALIAEVARHVPKPSTFVRAATDVSVRPAAGVVVVTSRMQEGSQGGANAFRYLTVLERGPSAWQVLAAQSTREVTLSTRVPATVAGPLADYVGSYRGQRGGALRIVARDSVLVLVDPEGGESRLEPVGPALFELPTLYDGIAIVRFAFARDATGRVTALSRLIHGSVVSWPRIS